VGQNSNLIYPEYKQTHHPAQKIFVAFRMSYFCMNLKEVRKITEISARIQTR